MKTDKLTPEEFEIEENAEQLRPVSIEKKHRIESIISRAKKNRSISLRISDFDLNLLKNKAQKEGVPYQTLINAVIHKYVTNQFLEKDEAIKILHLSK